MRQHIIITFLLLICCGTELSAQHLFSPAQNMVPKRESRAVWLTTLYGLDWPKTRAVNEAGRKKQQEELCMILDSLQKIHINTILLQTRVRGSMIYPSAIEPWDACLTGKSGKDPGYDPLAFAIEACHARGMELHAWLVTIPCFKAEAAYKMGRKSVLKTHPSLCKKHQGTWYLDPGVPETADYLSRLCAEITQNYDIDGIHFDYIRYPENAEVFPDQATWRKYGKGQSKDVWRRNNITRCVQSMYKTVKKIKPWVRVSSSPIGKFSDLSRFSSFGWNAYDAVHQDAQKWTKEGCHDMLFPMMYFQGNHFYPFAADWKQNSGNKPVVPGLGIYFLSEQEKNWNLDVIERELQFIRREGLEGQAYFRTKFLLDDVKGLYTYLKTFYYPYPALTPLCISQDTTPPVAPKDVEIRVHSKHRAQLVWSCATDDLNGRDVRYHIYASRQYPVDIRKASNLIKTGLRDTVFDFDPTYLSVYGLHFAVTATDRSGNESKAASPEKWESNSEYAGLHFHGDIRMDESGHTIFLPEKDAEFVIVQDMKGIILYTAPYATQIKIGHLEKGVYQVRTLEAKGISKPIGNFILTE